VQERVETFLASDGSVFLPPEPTRFFEPLTDPESREELNYVA
jgi:hypothetical protein